MRLPEVFAIADEKEAFHFVGYIKGPPLSRLERREIIIRDEDAIETVAVECFINAVELAEQLFNFFCLLDMANRFGHFFVVGIVSRAMILRCSSAALTERRRRD
jgi:hypothetical protein